MKKRRNVLNRLADALAARKKRERLVVMFDSASLRWYAAIFTHKGTGTVACDGGTRVEAIHNLASMTLPGFKAPKGATTQERRS